MNPRKPKAPRQWGSSLPVRTTWIKKGGKPKAVNRKRKASAFVRCYGSKKRVEWVKSLRCAAAHLGPCTAGLSQNAHTVNGGRGRKADADTIVPLCVRHHRMYDQYEHPFGRFSAWREHMKHEAVNIEAAWQASQGER